MAILAGKPYRSVAKAESTVVPRQEIFGGTVMVRAQAADSVYEPQTDTLPAPPLAIDLLPDAADPIVPGSLIFEWGGKTYIDRSRSEEHTSELQSRPHLVCRLLLEKKKER